MDLSLYQEIESLPDDLKKKVEEFVKSLKNQKPKKPAKRKLGLAKGMVKMKDDFDDPIPGMEDYMP